MSPKYFHFSLQKTLLGLIEGCCKGRGRILPEWVVVLLRVRRRLGSRPRSKLHFLRATPEAMEA